MNFPYFNHKKKSNPSTDYLYLLYNICFLSAFILSLPLLGLRMLWSGKYRYSFKSRLGLALTNRGSEKKNPRPVWMHALSVGETLSAIPLIKALVDRFPNVPLIFSTSTETGQETASKELGNMVTELLYFPLDLFFVVRRTLEDKRPCLFVLIETDLWPNFLRELSKRNIPAVLVNGRMSSASFKRYRNFRFFMKRVLLCFQAIGMQAPLYARRMVAMGALEDKVFVGGNLKFDQEHRIIGKAEREEMIGSLGWRSHGKRILVAGSTHAGEEESVIGAYSRLLLDFPEVVLIVAPRNLERVEKVRHIALAKELRCRKLSDPADPAAQVIVVDRMGELGRLYAVGEAAFVGGSMVKEGGHNILEPAAQRKPVLFGPYMDDFQEMAELIVEAGGGMIVSNQDELFRSWKSLLDSRTFSERAGESAYLVWQSNRGALQNYLQCLERFLN